MVTCSFCAEQVHGDAPACPHCGRTLAGGASVAPASPRGAAPYVALGCTVASILLTATSCGLAVMIREYREFTAPLTLIFGCAALALGWFAFRRFSRK